MKTKTNSSSEGFTLLELILALAIVSVLATIAVPRYASYVQRARATQCLSNRYNIEMETYGDSFAHHADDGAMKGYVRRTKADRLWLLVDNWLHAVTHLCRQANAADSPIGHEWICPSGGIYVWAEDPSHPDRSRVMCSLHGGALASSPEIDKEKKKEKKKKKKKKKSALK